MKSIKELYRIGNGPSSSHTLGPLRATYYIKNKYPTCKEVNVTLYGSLALTGKGHFTDYAIDKGLEGIKHFITFDKKTSINKNNPMLFEVILSDDTIIKQFIYSVGGGEIQIGDEPIFSADIYKEENLCQINQYCKEHNLDYYGYIIHNEGENIIDYINKVYDCMIASIDNGFSYSGVLPGGLNITYKAKDLLLKANEEIDIEMRNRKKAVSYAYAVSELNASGGELVTAPTYGSSGIIPAICKYLVEKGYQKPLILKGLLVAGLFGNLAKSNASISGAESGCQEEIGVACSMGCALLAYVYGYSIDAIERCAEISLEHHLGLTCDPVKGLVQIPCIERNGVGVLSCFDVVSLVSILPLSGKVSFDECLQTMYETGKDLKSGYRETAKKGLAKVFSNKR